MRAGWRDRFSRARLRGSRRFLGETTLSLGARGVAQLAELLIQVAVARALGVVQFGVFSLVWIWVRTGSNLAAMGLVHSAPRFLGAYRSLGQGRMARVYLRWMLGRGALAATAVVALGGVYLAARYERHEPVVIALAILLILAVASMNISGGVLRGLGGAIEGVGVAESSHSILGLAGIGLLLAAGALTVGSALIARLAGVVCCVLAGWVLARRRWKRTPWSDAAAESREGRRDWRRATNWFLVLSSVEMSESQLVPILVGAVGTDTDLGLFQAARHLPLLVSFVLASTTPLLVTRIPELWARRDLDGLQDMLRWNAAVSTAGGLVLAMAIGIPASFWLGLYGPEFGQATGALRLLLAVKLLSAALGPVYQMVWLTGHHQFAVRVMLIAAATGGLVAVVAVPALGCLGGAIASATCSLIWTGSFLWFSLSKLRLNPSVTAWLQPVASAPR